jgi:hypothetical protein
MQLAYSKIVLSAEKILKGQSGRAAGLHFSGWYLAIELFGRVIGRWHHGHSSLERAVYCCGF